MVLRDRKIQVNLVEAAFMQAATMGRPSNPCSITEACKHHHEEIQNNAGLPKDLWSKNGEALASRLAYYIRQNSGKIAGWQKEYGVNYQLRGPNKKPLPQYKRSKEKIIGQASGGHSTDTVDDLLDKSEDCLIAEANEAVKQGRIEREEVRPLEWRLARLESRVSSLEQAFIKGVK